MTNLKSLSLALLTFFCAFSVFSEAAVSYIDGVNITQIKAAAANFGQCTVVVDTNINTAGTENLNCGNSVTISLGCDGGFHSKSSAQNMFSIAQLSAVVGQPVALWVNDSKIYNGSVCTAESIIYVPPASP